MKINANIIVFTDDAREQFRDLPIEEKAMADIILGVTDRGTPMERTHIYKSRTSPAGQSWKTEVRLNTGIGLARRRKGGNTLGLICWR